MQRIEIHKHILYLSSNLHELYTNKKLRCLHHLEAPLRLSLNPQPSTLRLKKLCVMRNLTQTFLIIIVHSHSYQEFQVRKKKRIINTTKRTSTTCGSRGTKLGKLRSKPCPIDCWEILFGYQIREAIKCGFCSVKSERNLIIL